MKKANMNYRIRRPGCYGNTVLEKVYALINLLLQNKKPVENGIFVSNVIETEISEDLKPKEVAGGCHVGSLYSSNRLN